MSRADRSYTHPDVFTIGVRDGWADPITDPTLIDWSARLAVAAIPFRIVDGRPVNPCARTAIRYGRGELGHWGEALAGDALVSLSDQDDRRWILMVERGDGHGWALPGGQVGPGEAPKDAVVRELVEETGLDGAGLDWEVSAPRYVPDPRATDEAWMVTVLARAHLGRYDVGCFPSVVGGDDARRAVWVRADNFHVLAWYLHDTYGGQVFVAHWPLLREYLIDEAGPWRRQLFDLVSDGVSAGLPVPSSVDLVGLALFLWMDSAEEMKPWVRRWGLAWEPVRMYPSRLGGWQWSAQARRHDGDRRIQVTYLEALSVPGPAFVPAWLLETAGVAEPRSGSR